MSWLAAALGVLGRIADAFARALPLAMAYWAGRETRKAHDLSDLAEIQDEQLRQAARRPRDRGELVERLRRDGL